MPYDLNALEVEPIYIELKGWKTDLTSIKNLSEFPVELMEYVEFIENETNLPITIVSVGPNRDQTIMKEKALV
jgi:adenylosuccinate synthase